MKKMAIVLAVAVAALVSAQAQTTVQKLNANKAKISLADARSRIDKAIESPQVMRAIMKHLSAEDQKQFLADVNKAIADLPASLEERSAKFLAVNTEALAGAEKGNVSDLIAEMFATVPPEHLPVLVEQFGKGALSRSSASGEGYSDADFQRMAESLMKKVVTRTAETDNGSPRSALAIVMLVMASNGSPADLSDKLIDMLQTEEARDLARSEWIPNALGLDNRQKSYESIMASADAGRRPDLDYVLVIAGPQYPISILHDLYGKSTDLMSYSRTKAPVLDAVENPLAVAYQHLGAEVGGDVRVGGWQPGGDVPHEVRPQPQPPQPQPEPGPYQWQRK